METLFEANGKDEDEKNGEAGAIDTTDKPNARTHETMESLCSVQFEFLECMFIISFKIFQEVQYTVSSRRWLVLALFVLYSSSNSFQWTQLVIITNILEKYYQVSTLAISWTSMIYMVTYIPLIFPASWLLQKKVSFYVTTWNPFNLQKCLWDSVARKRKSVFWGGKYVSTDVHAFHLNNLILLSRDLFAVIGWRVPLTKQGENFKYKNIISHEMREKWLPSFLK